MRDPRSGCVGYSTQEVEDLEGRSGCPGGGHGSQETGVVQHPHDLLDRLDLLGRDIEPQLSEYRGVASVRRTKCNRSI